MPLIIFVMIPYIRHAGKLLSRCHSFDKCSAVGSTLFCKKLASFGWSRNIQTAVPTPTSPPTTVKTLCDKTSNSAIPDLSNIELLYKCKTTKELLRGYMVLSLCSIDVLVDRHQQLLTWARRVLGAGLFRRMMKATIYGQFGAGDTSDEVLAVARRDGASGVSPVITYAAAEIHGSANPLYGQVSLEIEKNIVALEESIALAAQCKDFHPRGAGLSTKISHFTQPQTLAELTEIINAHEKCFKNILSRPDSEEAVEFCRFLTDVYQVAQGYGDIGLQTLASVPDISPLTMGSLLTNTAFHLALARHKDRWLYLDAPTLTSETESSVIELWKRIDKMSQLIRDAAVTMWWDAEQTYLQPAVECLALDTMRRYNTDRAVFYNTYQCYLKRAMAVVNRDLDVATNEGFYLGLKIVRGAYMEEERHRAVIRGYEDPVNPTLESTATMYNDVSLHVLDRIQRQGDHANIQVIFATHNADAIENLLKSLYERGVSVSGEQMLFVQLRGMRDHLTYGLCQAGIPTAKLSLYGPVECTLSVLSRKILENKSGLPMPVLERALLRQELKRRLLPKY